eukprot:7187643-Pyramimonas_sp.AAC.1
MGRLDNGLGALLRGGRPCRPSGARGAKAYPGEGEGHHRSRKVHSAPEDMVDERGLPADPARGAWLVLAAD